MSGLRVAPCRDEAFASAARVNQVDILKGLSVRQSLVAMSVTGG